MVVKISAHKTLKILYHYYKGLPQPEIAKKCNVNQATVSRYAAKFELDVNEVGIIKAAKEYGIMNEVGSLRSLAVELFNNKLTTEEAKEGLTIWKYFSNLNVDPGEYKSLVTVISELKNPDFVPSALKLAELKSTTNKSYIEILSHYEQVAKETMELKQQNVKLKQEQNELDHQVKQLIAQENNERESLKQFEGEMNHKKTALQVDLGGEMKKNNLTLDRMKKLEQIVKSLHKMNISDEKVETFLAEHQELEKIGLTMDTLKTIVKGMNK